MHSCGRSVWSWDCELFQGEFERPGQWVNKRKDGRRCLRNCRRRRLSPVRALYDASWWWAALGNWFRWRNHSQTTHQSCSGMTLNYITITIPLRYQIQTHVCQNKQYSVMYQYLLWYIAWVRRFAFTQCFEKIIYYPEILHNNAARSWTATL